MFSPQSITVTTAAGKVRVHLVSTGVVSVKTKFREAKRHGIPGMLNYIIDKQFTEWMPIWVMIIEHPEGVFVIDTGENAQVNDPGYFKSSGTIANWFDTTQFKFEVQPEEEIGPWLEKLGINTSQIKAVILTHLHLDHADGLKYFPQTPILVNRREWQKPFGDLPKLYPPWFKPTLVDLDEPFEMFERAKFITEARDLLMIETPGHTFHHASLILLAEEAYILFAADICYSQEQLLKGKFAGTNAKHSLASDTYARVNSFAARNPTVFIPSHDGEAGLRLKELQLLKSTPAVEEAK